MQGIVREKLRNIAGNMIWYEFNYHIFCTSADNCWSRTLSLRCLFKSPRWRSCKADQKVIRRMDWILRLGAGCQQWKQQGLWNIRRTTAVLKQLVYTNSLLYTRVLSISKCLITFGRYRQIQLLCACKIRKGSN